MDQEDSLLPNEKLRGARKQRGWKQREVAEKIGAPDASMVSDWERGKNTPTGYYQERLCQLFEMDNESLGFIEQGQAKKARRQLSTIPCPLENLEQGSIQPEQMRLEIQESSTNVKDLLKVNEHPPSLIGDPNEMNILE